MLTKDFVEKGIHPALVLRPNCVPEGVGVNKKDVNEKVLYPMRNNAIK
jgi:hypothetical protein